MNDEPRQILEALRNLATIVDVLSWIASRFDKAIDRIESQQALDDVLRELQDYLTGNIDRIDRMLLLILEKLADPNSERVQRETGELRREAVANRVRSLRLQRQQYYDNLNAWQEQAASYGETPEIRNHVSAIQRKIREIDEEIKTLA